MTIKIRISDIQGATDEATETAELTVQASWRCEEISYVPSTGLSVLDKALADELKVRCQHPDGHVAPHFAWLDGEMYVEWVTQNS